MKKAKRVRTGWLCSILVAALACFGPQRSNADIWVNNFDDSGPGTLRQAIADAAPGETIRFLPLLGVATIYLTNELVIDKSLTIAGGGAPYLYIDGNDLCRAFRIALHFYAPVIISGLTIINCNSSDFLGLGGGIFNNGAATLTVSNCSFASCRALHEGGAIYNFDSLLIRNCTFVGGSDTSYGGAIANHGSLDVFSSSFVSNSAVVGGAIYNHGSVSVNDCTLYGNSGNGGAIYGDFNTTFGATNSTFYQNDGQSGPALGFVTVGSSLNHCTIVGNKGRLGALRGGVTIQNTIVAGNLDEDVMDDFESAGHNFIGRTNGSYGWVATDQTGSAQAPLIASLTPLQDNGGPTLTMAPLPHATGLVDRGTSGGLAFDQRGQPRIYDSSCQANTPGGDGSDIGAVELQGPVITSPPVSVCALPGSNVTFTVAATGHPPLTYTWVKVGQGTVVSGPDATCTLTNAQAQDEGTYYVTVEDALNCRNSSTASLTLGKGLSTTVTGAGTVMRNPDGIAYCSSRKVQLTAIPNSGWIFIGWSGDAPGTNNPVSVTMTNDKSITANFASAPVFTTPPASRTNGVGTVATFTGFAAGTPSPNYQWQFNGTNILGATAASYSRTNVQFSDAGNYALMASNVVGSVTSPPALLVVIPCPGYNISSASPLRANAGAFYTGLLNMSTGYPPYTFSVRSGSLPLGIGLSSSGNLSGIAAREGVSMFGVTGTDIYGCSATSNFVFQVLPANTFVYSGGSLRIPPSGTGGSGIATQDITVATISAGFAGTQLVKNVSVGLLAEHARDGDLRITLTPPGGSPILLSDQRGGSGSNFTYTTFRNFEPTNIADASAPFTGTFRPEGTLTYSNFGNWQLQIEDKTPGNIGQLLSWWLTIQQSPRIESNAWIWSTNLSSAGFSVVTDSAATNSAHRTFVQYGNSLSALRTRDGLLEQNYALNLPSKLGLLDAGPTASLLVAATNGFVYCVRPSDGFVLWSRDTRRTPLCPSDTLSAAPVTQLRRLSDAAYQAALPIDLVFVVTDYKCGTSTANAVIGLVGTTGAVAWRSDSFSANLDRGTGLAVDYQRNTVYCVTDKTGVTAPTVQAFASTNGAPRWVGPGIIGAVQARPLLANGALFVGAKSGAVYKLNPSTGQIIWTNVSGLSITNDLGFDPSRNRLLITRTNGQLSAIDDLGASSTVAWATNLNGALASSAAVVATNFDKVYVGARDGRVYQLNPGNGQIESSGTVLAGNPVFDLSLDSDDGGPAQYRLVAMSASRLVRAAIPWGLSAFDKGTVTPIQTDVHLAGSPPATLTSLGQPIPYTLQVSGSGGPPLDSVTVWDSLPAGMGFQSATSSQGILSVSGNQLTAELGYLLPVTASISLVVTSSTTGILSHTAAIGGPYRDNLLGLTDTLTDNGVLITHIVVDAPPVLNIGLIGSNVLLSWTTNAPGYTLTSNTNLNSTNWTVVTPGPVVQGPNYAVTNELGSSALFYRLRKP